ncbi:AAA family ATPase [Filomicrobium sp.]|uniref:ATP-binding protein n=1 Tax=Filomicrobium sp. TaxID=2024831 RepID=UPI0025825CEF|nr:AAA family ATPase [Filomicrobium sp.]MCV0370797.1 AAA family ATPase [Filomicrobium sp.]
MNQPVIAFVGISGVGKSTLLRTLSQRIKFQHLQAGVLIKAARENVPSENLRNQDIEDNQLLLIEGFHAAKDANAPLIIIDGHTVVDTPKGLIGIEPIIFAQLGITQFIFLADDSQAISARRLNDTTKNRPKRTPVELEIHQRQALLSAFSSARHLNIPLLVVSAEQFENIYSNIRSLIHCQARSSRGRS